MAVPYVFLDFQILNEQWNQYRLSDGVALKLKFVLRKVQLLKTANGKAGEIRIDQTTIVATEVPTELLGPPGKEYSLEEIAQSIVDPDIPFDALSRTPFSYLLSDGKLVIVEIQLRTVGKSSLFGETGEPKYKINFETRVNIIGPPPLVPEDK